MNTRVKKGQLKYLRYLLVEGNYLVKRVAEEILESKRGKWIKRVTKEIENLKELSLMKGSIRNYTRAACHA